ncbi:hypothetical protein RBH26_00995 [Natronolimnohabitans sp. A-GB9]|nr:hypothetical protein [Natronolimnohabitans sp. A-GB9]MDQ2049052.1 hypothetical protein [Natronolimnohabitans sp. A-GB9]
MDNDDRWGLPNTHLRRYEPDGSVLGGLVHDVDRRQATPRP